MSQNVTNITNLVWRYIESSVSKSLSSHESLQSLDFMRCFPSCYFCRASVSVCTRPLVSVDLCLYLYLAVRPQRWSQGIADYRSRASRPRPCCSLSLPAVLLICLHPKFDFASRNRGALSKIMTTHGVLKMASFTNFLP